MNKNLLPLTAAALLWALAPAPASAISFGLGKAVAGQGAKVTDKAANPLPSCGGNFALFTQPPVTDANLVSVSPVGSQSSHIFPPDHMYFNYNEPMPNLGTVLYAPSNGWVVQVTVNNQSSGLPFGINPNYYIGFSPCAEVTLNILSIATISPALTAALSAPTSVTRCSSFNNSGGGPNPEIGEGCVTYMQVPVHAGDVLGTGLVADFGPLQDTRVSISGFANPSRHDLHRGLCPLDYWAPNVLPAAHYTPGYNLGTTVFARTASPTCGTIMQDVPGTAQGDWYFPGAANLAESAHLALVHDIVFTSSAVFSVGTSMTNFGGILQTKQYFQPKTAPDGTRIDYDFNLVNDGQIYCYDTFSVASPVFAASPDLSGYVVLLQLDSTKTNLTIELQNPATNCAGASPWSFTNAAIGYQR